MYFTPTTLKSEMPDDRQWLSLNIAYLCQDKDRHLFLVYTECGEAAMEYPSLMANLTVAGMMDR